MGLPVLLMPGAPSGLQKAPGVTPALGAGASAVGAGSGRGAGTGAGSSGAGTCATVEGAEGAKGCIATGVVGAGVTGISVGSELVAGVGVRFVIVVAGAVLGSEFVCVPDSTESSFGATTPIMMSHRKDAARTHPAVLRLRMRAQPKRPRTRLMTAITTRAIHTRTRMDTTACMNFVPLLLMPQLTRCRAAPLDSGGAFYLSSSRPQPLPDPRVRLRTLPIARLDTPRADGESACGDRWGQSPFRLCHHGSVGRGGLGGPGGRGGACFAVGGDQEGEDRQPGEQERARAAE